MKLTGKRCQCGSCRQYFNSLTAFDAHRVGTYQPDTRRCLPDLDMVAKGMIKNRGGWWTTKASDRRSYASGEGSE